MKETVYILLTNNGMLKVCIGIYKTKKEAENAAIELNKALKVYNYSAKSKSQMKKAEKVIYKYLDNYYVGCGGIWSVSVKEVFFGEPFASWDLD